jgi:ornithine cyclodeaminase/alanine dehydrogenase-like protein (mu-crystallin family)
MLANVLYLSQKDVVSVGLKMEKVIEALEKMFQKKGQGRVEMPPKIGIHPRGDAFIHAMPAYIPALKSAGIKWVSCFPKNPERKLPYTTGLIILNNPETGLPLVIMDCAIITAMRTGAATAVAAKYLARPESETVGILGCGVQGRSNLSALNTLFPIKTVKAYDIYLDHQEKFAQEMEKSLSVEIKKVNSPAEALDGSDIIVTAGPILKIPHATIKPGWMEEGAFASSVDYDSYWSREALKEIDKFCTDDFSQLKSHQKMGYFQEIPSVHADLGELVTGKKQGRENSRERILACNLGLALDDVAVAPIVYEMAVKKGIGTWLPL